MSWNLAGYRHNYILYFLKIIVPIMIQVPEPLNQINYRIVTEWSNTTEPIIILYESCDWSFESRPTFLYSRLFAILYKD